MSFVATIGFFDGVHLGHRYVLKQVVAMAGEEHLQSLVVTFCEHPRSVLGGDDSAGMLLTTADERLNLIKAEGINQVEMLCFADIRDMTAAKFLLYLKNILGVEVLLMGYDHRFGCDCLTQFADYEAAAERAGIRLVRLHEYEACQTHVSSTAIRRLLSAGRVEEANHILGYHYMLTGKVVHGRGIGRQLGFPTANIVVDRCKLVPADGVYAVSVDTADGGRKAVLNIGSNPTVSGSERTLEVHIIGFDGELYNKQLTLHLLRYIRAERLFDSTEALRHQIELDLTCLETSE